MRVLNSAALLIHPLSVPSMDTAANEAFIAGRSFWYLVSASQRLIRIRHITTLNWHPADLMTLEAASSSTQGRGWAPSGLASTHP